MGRIGQITLELWALNDRICYIALLAKERPRFLNNVNQACMYGHTILNEFDNGPDRPSNTGVMGLD